MKNIYSKILAGMLMVFPCTSCSDFFDNEPDNIETIEELFRQRTGTLQLLANVYSYIRPPYQWSNESIWTGVSDELDVAYADYQVNKINLGLLAPDKEDLQYGNYWSYYYKGIRAATQYMLNVYTNEEIPQSEMDQYHDEAQVLRAWYYFCLVRQYGPVVILPEELIPGDATVADMNIARSSVSKCFDYIIGQLDEVIARDHLVHHSKMVNADYGHVTNIVAKAIRARALLYRASDLYNHDRTSKLFKDFRNSDGSLMMDYTDEGRKERWEEAAQANKQLISDMRNEGLELYMPANNSLTAVISNYRKIFTDSWGSNKEVFWIHTKSDNSYWEMRMGCTPHGPAFSTNGNSGWGGWGPTQETVDAFFMANGQVPITGYNADGSPIINPASGYVDNGISPVSFTIDEGITESGINNMYCNREPRFYVAITYENRKWFCQNGKGKAVTFHYNGNAGPGLTENRNYSTTGYLPAKFLDPADNTTQSSDKRPGVLMRVGEFYLNAAEAACEAGEPESDVLYYLNTIRRRAGIPEYGTSGLPVPGNRAELLEAIRRERRVELVFEEARYFDCCRWCIAHKYFNGPMHGMNVQDPLGENDTNAYFQRKTFESRIFPEHNLLWPIPLSDIYKASKLVQNPEWSSISSDNMVDPTETKE